MKQEEKTLSELKSQIDVLIDSYFHQNLKEIENHYPLVSPSFGSTEVKEAVDSLLSTYVTMGKKCSQFERDFAKYINTKYSIFVNSGSTANLIALSILTSPDIINPLKPGDEIITSAVTWSTTVFPIYDVGAIPVFVDTDPETMTMNTDQLKEAISDKTKVIMPVHLLGNPCDMKSIMSLATEHNLYVIEDCCEAHGTKLGNRMIGSFGDLSTFSFFFSHHISTIEGGMVLTNNFKFLQIGRSLRAHGWVREREDKMAIMNQNPTIDPRFLFVHKGFNVRPTEIQGAFGIHQLPKLETFIEARIKAAHFLIDQLTKFNKFLILPTFLKDSRQSWFGFPIIVKEDSPFTRSDLINFLENHKIETRPIMGGNFVEQPVMEGLEYKTTNSLPHSHFIFHHGIFLGLHNNYNHKILEYVVTVFNEFFLPFTK
ncbi:MAG: DegT/DnrJ/EryC1/StrS family aminotransferase [Candidatus Hodarchaeales archaeon]|jgi:CDP-6-deoxy-D-xylo-4-hexulose-3-dehydrase